MAEILDLNPETFADAVAQDRIVLVDAWAAWCGPCRVFAPIFEKAADDHPDHVFAKLDTEAHKDLVGKLGIVNIPTLMIYREGILLYHEAGSPTADVLEDLIKQVESLDMAVVRAEIAAEEAGSGQADQA